MTHRERILSAFAPKGADAIGAVACYDEILIRDHWFELTDTPWWYAFEGEVEQEVAVAKDYAERTGLGWITVRPCPSRAERARRRFEERSDGVWLVDPETDEEARLVKPGPSSVGDDCARSRPSDLDALPGAEAAVDALVPPTPALDRGRFLAEGRHDAAAAIREKLDLVLYGHVASPVWSLYNVLGYEGMMVFLARDPDLALYAGKRILAFAVEQVRIVAALGADAVWIEECLTDQISPALFETVNVPLVRACVEAVRAAGMKSVYYYCGDPNDRLDAILAPGADAVHFEEGKKGFTVDIAAIAARIGGRCALFGNLDAIAVLQDGSEAGLRAEVERQIQAAETNTRRFILSTGSPITPGTPVERVRRYAETVGELAS